MDTRDNRNIAQLEHGGQLNKVAKLYSIPPEQWLDLSTGISPISYPIPNIPQHIWQQLPQTSTGLHQAAKSYYQTENISVTSGSQAVIARLPSLYLQTIKKPAQQVEVWLPKVGYKEHEKSWRNADFTIKQYQQLPDKTQLAKNAVVVVINPNNPSGVLQQKQPLTELLKTIEQLSGWLIIDEAFMDVIKPNQSLIHLTHNKHLFVLRSFGKFFGLAGIRIGFLSAHQYWLDKLAQLSSPWEVNGPAQFIAEQALKDRNWQLKQQQALTKLAAKLELLLTETFIDCAKSNSLQKITVSGCDLFKTLIHPQATEIHQSLCQQGLYVRLCDEKNALRFGIPTHEQNIILASLLAKHCHG